MKEYTFGFIGCGNMGGALARAIAKSVKGASLLLCDANAEKAELLAGEIGGASLSLEEVVGKSDYLFLGVKPQTLPTLFDVLKPMLDARKTPPVLVSMAAGVSLATLSEYAGGEVPVIRIMPTLPVAVGEGVILYTANAGVNGEMLSDFCQALAKAGVTDYIEEDKIDAASALSGCGPAFVYLFADALADGAVACGLSREKALLYASQTLAGAAEMLMTTGEHPATLKDAVCSPGGSTIEGVKALEEGAFRATTMQAVMASYEKTLMLGGRTKGAQ